MRSYPHALYFLELLQSQDFRAAMARAPVKVHPPPLLRLRVQALGGLTERCGIKASGTLALYQVVLFHKSGFKKTANNCSRIYP